MGLNFRNSRGMTLMETLIALVLSSIMIASVAVSVQNMSKSQATADAGQDLTSMMYDISTILNNTSLCTTAMRGTNSVNDAQVSINNNIRSNSKYGALNIGTVLLKNVTNITGVNYSAEVEILGTRRGQVTGSTGFNERAKVFYAVDGANRIQDCITKGNSAEADCIAVGGTWTGAKCDFCASLGGTVLADGSCQLMGSTVFGWQIGPWGTCASGSQTRVVQCVDTSTGTIVMDAACSAKPLTTQPCALYDWQIGAWGTCTAGNETRSVTCIDTFTLAAAPGGDADCTTAKPGTSQPCTGPSCTLNAGASWTVASAVCTVGATTVIPDGSTTTVTDSTGPSLGSAAYTCTGGTLTGPASATCTAGTACGITCLTGSASCGRDLTGSTGGVRCPRFGSMSPPPSGTTPIGACPASMSAGQSCGYTDTQDLSGGYCYYYIWKACK